MRRRPSLLVALLAARLFMAAGAGLAAEGAAGQEGLRHRVMSNGLEVFVAENRAVPLATVCVAFRGGASAQTPGNAGLFHLYEHMLFAGNARYPTKEAFTAALKRMGTTSWNGATGTEYINYHITIPSDRLEDGLEFWAAAVRAPSFDPATLETEKGVVLNEIRGYHADPARIASNALSSRMFPEYPWRKNIDGPEANIERAAVADLRTLQAAFYIPRNAALLVGGDVSAERVFELTEKHFGGWTGGSAPDAGAPHGALPGGIRLVAPDPSYYRGIAQVQFRWRGPDVLAQTADTYASDVLLFLMSSPVGRFKQALMGRVPGLYDPEYIDFSYPTARDGGAFSFSTFMVVSKPEAEGAVLDRVEALREAVLAEFAEIERDPEAYFGSAELAKAKTKLVDQNLYAVEAADDFVTNTLTFWWSVATADYFLGYEKACGEVSWADIAGLVRRYLTGASATLVRIRESTYASDLKMSERIAALGYTKVGAANAFWWQK